MTTKQAVTHELIGIISGREQPKAVAKRIVEMMGWQDIATAPKDGTWVLVWDGEIHVAEWDGETSSGEPWGWADARENGVRLDPTHWMPLPEAPKS